MSFVLPEVRADLLHAPQLLIPHLVEDEDQDLGGQVQQLSPLLRLLHLLPLPLLLALGEPRLLTPAGLAVPLDAVGHRHPHHALIQHATRIVLKAIC